jgi:hypothetical protein
MTFTKMGIIASLLCIPAFLRGATIGQIDTFQDGTTDGWFAGGLGMGMVPPIPPHVVTTGGPSGAGDQFLQITAVGGVGAGSRIAAINTAQWAGNYLSAGIAGIGMDLKNLGTTELTVRLLFEDPMGGPPVDEAVTTFGQVVPVGGGWLHAFFPISPAAFTTISGNVNTLLAQTTLMRIINSPTPEDAITIVGTLGVDNIQAVPEPSSLLLVLPAMALGALKLRRKLAKSNGRSFYL